MGEFVIIQGNGDFDSPSECWGVSLVDVRFTDETRDYANILSDCIYDDILESLSSGDDYKSFFVLVVDVCDLPKWGLVK